VASAPAEVSAREARTPEAAAPTALEEQARRLADFFNGDVVQEPIDDVA
jgi:hypothetical protein